MRFKIGASFNDSESGIEEDNPQPPMKRHRLHSETDIFNSRLFDEIVIKIFECLDYKDLLMAASLVCRRWEMLSKSPELWRTLWFCCKSNLKSETVERLLKLSDGVQYIAVDQCPLIGDSVISEIAKQNKLKILEIDRCGLLSKDILGLISNCRSLRQLSLQRLPLTDDALRKIAESCTNLTLLDITADSGSMFVTNAGLLPVIQHCTQLRYLIIDLCRKVDDDFLVALAAMPNQLVCLDISRCKFTEEGLKYLGKLPKLRKIYARIVKTLSDSVVSVFSNLTCVSITESRWITESGISTILHKNPNIEYLSLYGCKHVGDTTLEMTAKSPCRLTLKNLNINNCPVSEIGIDLILQNCTKLRYLTCSKIPEVSLDRWRIDYPHILLHNIVKI